MEQEKLRKEQRDKLKAQIEEKKNQKKQEEEFK